MASWLRAARACDGGAGQGAAPSWSRGRVLDLRGRDYRASPMTPARGRAARTRGLTTQPGRRPRLPPIATGALANMHPQQTRQRRRPMFDYLIVGGGSAGCVLAARPQRGPFDAQVGLLEAGQRGHQRADPLPGRHRGRWPGPRRDATGLPHRAAAGPERPHGLPAARQGARRLQLDQRHDLRPRPARGLRPLGRRRATPAGRWDDVLPLFQRAEHNERGADALARRRRPAERDGPAGSPNPSVALLRRGRACRPASR
ncbi:MAG: hypothetical protein MZW92_22485 [Comamonadaceae bacterium]|nr:hypothetical protein [Comamonadaceae bacterium]